MTVECLTWLLVMYFAPRPQTYDSTISWLSARFENSDSTMKILSRGHPYLEPGRVEAPSFLKEFSWNLHKWDPLRSLYMEPSPLPVFTDSSSEALAPDTPPHGVEGRPACSSTNVCQWGVTSQCPGGCNTPSRVGSQPERAGHTMCLISQGDGIHYPVGDPLLRDGIPLLLAPKTDKELN